jgi:hypothetical protein
MNTKLSKFLVTVGLLILTGAMTSAFAANYTFNFNSVAAGATNGSIQTYMQSVVGGAATVGLSGAKEANGYNGDGHVVGTCVSGVCISKTLGNDDTGTDRFIITLQSGSTDTIKMQFSGLNIYSITFDYEIFPDATCPSPSNCPNGRPDMTVFTGNGGTASNQILHDYGAFPASGQHSPYSGAFATETAAQGLVLKYTYSSATPFDTIWFQDWPATIGVDNITISTNAPPPQVPEPASIMLVSSGVLAVLRRKSFKK